MLRVNVGLSRKLSRDYNSTGYSVNIDGEVTAPISDPEAVVQQVNELFDLAEETLNQQIERAEGNVAIANRDTQPTNGASGHANDQHDATNGRETKGASNGNGQRNGVREEEPATNKQVNYLLNIGKRQSLTTAQLESRVAAILGRPVGLYDLTKKSAGVVIDALTGDKVSANTTSPI